MKIAYVGKAAGTSLHRAQALRRLGHHVELVDPWAWIDALGGMSRLLYHMGYLAVGWLINDRLALECQRQKPDIVWVNQGEFLDVDALSKLRKIGVPLINFANDNPFSEQNRRRFGRYRRSLYLYDLVVVVFEDAIQPAKDAGAKKVIRKFLSADEVAHCQAELNTLMKTQKKHDVVFVGTCFGRRRSSFVAELIDLGIPLSIWGDHWSKAKEWKRIEPHWRGQGVYNDTDYASLLMSGKICLGLLNQESGNLHTDRSIQIPALGSLLCAERTSEHLAMYIDNKEAVFWGSAEECAEKCLKLLANQDLMIDIARQGHARAMHNNYFNEPVMESILEEIDT